MMLRITVGFKVKVECGELGNALNSCILGKKGGWQGAAIAPCSCLACSCCIENTGAPLKSCRQIKTPVVIIGSTTVLCFFLRLSIISTPSSLLSKCVVCKVLRTESGELGYPACRVGTRGTCGIAMLRNRKRRSACENGFWLERKLYVVDNIAMNPELSAFDNSALYE